MNKLKINLITNAKIISIYLNNIINNKHLILFTWGLGIGDWGLGIGPNPQSPIPNPQSPFNIKYRNNNIIY